MRKSLGQQVVRGMGSGIPINQKLAGAEDPEAAAAFAANPDLNQLENEMKEDEDVTRKIALINEAISEGFVPAFDQREIDSNPSIVYKVFEAMENWRQSKEEDFEFEYNVPPDDPLYDPIRDVVRRRKIEAGLKELDFNSMIFKGYCSQEVKIREGFTVVFRTLNTNQSLWIESMTLKLQEKSVQYGRHWMSLVQLAVCLESVNGQAIQPNIYKFVKANQEDDFQTALNARMEFIGQLPQIVSDDLIIQYAWFSSRVRKLMSGDVVEKLGNS